MSITYDSMPLQSPLRTVSILGSFYLKLFSFSPRPAQFISWACAHIVWHSVLRRDSERQEDQVWRPAELDWRHHGTSHRILNHQWGWDSILCHKVLCWIHQIQNPKLRRTWLSKRKLTNINFQLKTYFQKNLVRFLHRSNNKGCLWQIKYLIM